MKTFNQTVEQAIQLAFLASAAARRNLRALAWDASLDENDTRFLLGDDAQAWSLRWDAANRALDDLCNYEVIQSLNIPTDVISGNFIKGLMKVIFGEGGPLRNHEISTYQICMRTLDVDAFVRLIEDEEEPLDLKHRRPGPAFVDDIWSYGTVCFLNRDWDTHFANQESLNFMRVWAHAFDRSEYVYRDLIPNSGIHPITDEPQSLSDICGMDGVGYLAAYRVLPVEVGVDWLASDNSDMSSRDKISFTQFSRHIEFNEAIHVGLTSMGIPSGLNKGHTPHMKKFGSMIPGGISEGEYDLVMDLAHDIAVCLAEYNEKDLKQRTVISYRDFVLVDNEVFAEPKSKYAMAVRSIIWRKAPREFENVTHGECDFNYVRACYLIRQLGNGIFDEMVALGLIDKFNADSGGI